VSEPIQRYLSGVKFSFTPFARLWLSQAVSMLGDFIAVFAIQVSVVFRMHGSPSDMAGVFIASSLPSVILGPIAGVFADRWNPRRMMISSDLIRAGLIVLLGLAANLPQIYAISLAVSCASSFFSPARSIVMPALIPGEQLMRAASHMQQTMQIMRIASPAVAAALVAAFGDHACFWADSLSFVFSAAMIATLRLPRAVPAPQGARVRAITSELAGGLRYLCTDSKTSFIAMAMAAGTFAAGCFGALAPLYVRDVLQARSATLGLMTALIGMGTLLGSVAMGWLPKLSRREPSQLMGGGMAWVGVSILMMGARPLRSISLAASLGIGLGVSMVVVVSTVILQTNTPVEFRGRVSGAASALASLAQLVSMLFAGVLAAHIGIRGVFVVSAALLLAVSLTAMRQKTARSDLSQIQGIALRQDAA
jgi:DHA3 family macrolide efflux protein-like MFS transporter